jgi:hypothetical protein
VDAYGLTDRARIVPALQRCPLAGELRWIHGISPDLARAL